MRTRSLTSECWFGCVRGGRGKLGPDSRLATTPQGCQLTGGDRSHRAKPHEPMRSRLRCAHDRTSPAVLPFGRRPCGQASATGGCGGGESTAGARPPLHPPLPPPPPPPPLLHPAFTPPPPSLSRFVTTIGVDYRDKVVEVAGRTVKLQIWDTAGQERFRSLTANFFSRADGTARWRTMRAERQGPFPSPPSSSFRYGLGVRCVGAREF